MEEYQYKACKVKTNNRIVALLKESCGIRSISRLLKISCTTVLKRILHIAHNTKKPAISFNQTYEVDELCTYIGNKQNRKWIVYALCKANKQIIDFRIGNRTLGTLAKVVSTLQLAKAEKICTDKFSLYQSLIPTTIHSTELHATNHIECMNLTLRTNLKRLSRRTICFSKSIAMLGACLSICFWD